MKNNMSDWDAKKAFTTKYLYQNNYIPQIYIDDYWNYYIEEYNLTQVWDNFLKQFKDDNLTYTSYMDEYNRLLDEVPKLFTIESDKNKIVDIIDKRLSTKENSVISYIEGLYTLPEGNYITVDIHSAFDEALKYIGVFNPSYISTNDIINNTSKYSIFNGNKLTQKDAQAIISYSNALKNGASVGQAWSANMTNCSVAAKQYVVSAKRAGKSTDTTIRSSSIPIGMTENSSGKYGYILWS